MQELHQQCLQTGVTFEIRVYDDGSRPDIRQLNRLLDSLDRVYYLELQQNIGRSAIRNLLAREAQYAFLLFIDNDNLIPRPDYVQKYLALPEQVAVVLGGTNYADAKPSSAQVLRWRYGREREQRSLPERRRHSYRYFALNNTLCLRELFLRFGLDERIRGYGFEDVAFGVALEKAGVPVQHIFNPVVHVGLDRAEVFLEKTRQAMRNLHELSRCEEADFGSRLLQTSRLLHKTGTAKPFLFVTRLLEKRILRNLHSPDPSLFYFDLYRLRLLVALATGASQQKEIFAKEEEKEKQV